MGIRRTAAVLTIASTSLGINAGAGAIYGHLRAENSQNLLELQEDVIPQPLSEEDKSFRSDLIDDREFGKFVRNASAVAALACGFVALRAGEVYATSGENLRYHDKT